MLMTLMICVLFALVALLVMCLGSWMSVRKGDRMVVRDFKIFFSAPNGTKADTADEFLSIVLSLLRKLVQEVYSLFLKHSLK
jgi:hypothetical protein